MVHQFIFLRDAMNDKSNAVPPSVPPDQKYSPFAKRHKSSESVMNQHKDFNWKFPSIFALLFFKEPLCPIQSCKIG